MFISRLSILFLNCVSLHMPITEGLWASCDPPTLCFRAEGGETYKEATAGVHVRDVYRVAVEM